MEAGFGVNERKYFVTGSSLDDWVKLPDAAPTHLRAARDIKVLFTGNLERLIYTNPFFEAKAEKFYLRAQIARIVQATTLTWKGSFKVTEADGDVDNREIEQNLDDEGNGPKPPLASGLKSLD